MRLGTYVVVCSFLVGCTLNEGPDYEVGWITARLVAAGYTVSPPTPDGEAPKAYVTHGECLTATKAGETDRFCVLRCTSRTSCRPTWTESSPLGESYGEMYRGSTVLIHRACGHGGCGVAHDAIHRR